MELFFIRHAQSTNNALYAETGVSNGRSEDPDITDLGLKQAQLLAEFLQSGDPDGGNHKYNHSPVGFGITHLYSSLMVRAVVTGTIIGDKLGLPLRGHIDLHECGGIFDEDGSGMRRGLPGKPRDYFKKNFSRFIIPKSLGEEGWWNRPFEEESERLPRAFRCLSAFLEVHKNSNDRVAVISHGGFYNEFLTAVYGQTTNKRVWARLYNTAITRIDFSEGGVELVYSNLTTHLPVELLT